MPFEITLENLPAGFVAEAKAKGAPGPLMVRVTGFAYYEDGADLINVLEGISDAIISRLPKEAGITESKISNMLAVIRKDRTATVYINELKFISLVRVKKAQVSPGDVIYDGDIADIRKIQIEGIKIPDDAGVVIVLSSRWRKAVFYDYGPISIPPAGVPRTFDIEITLAQMWIRLLFNDRFKITEAEWVELFKKQWFPFVSLGSERIRGMLNHVRNLWDLDLLLDDIENDMKSRVPVLKSHIAKEKSFEGHREVISEALDSFLAGKYLATTAILVPRLEGIMRSRHTQVNPGVNASQTKLSESAIADPSSSRHELSLLMPERFKEYLGKVYFASFDPKNISGVSRNTVSHGVAPEKMLLDKKAAVIAVLILEQLAYFCGV